jgi:hypothetical protein
MLIFDDYPQALPAVVANTPGRELHARPDDWSDGNYTDSH